MYLSMDTFYNEVNDWLLVGADLDIAFHLTGMEAVETIEFLRAQGVTHVVDARIEWSDADLWEDAGLPAANYCHAPITDSYSHKPAEGWFCAVEDFVADFLVNRNEGDKLYVHCHMGVNRGPSAAMLALLVADADLHPWDAFLAIREARSIAGLVYAESVGIRHISRSGGADDALYAALGDFRKSIQDYWSADRIEAVNRGIAYYRDGEGGTLTV
jgi:dual specificity phosphatase 3